ncbi:MAG: repeat-containing protein YrrB [Pedosphaera sp.]|nr:repeat-containing protein YrrB [Pedosphaera sp.]
MKPRLISKKQQPNKSSGKLYLGAFAIFLLTVLAYLPVFHAGFIWDDNLMLTNNPVVQSPHGLFFIWFSTVLPDYFPLTSTSLWMEWFLWGKNPVGYHVINLLLHAGSAMFLWRVLSRLRIPGAWVVAMLFAVHPVNVESVAWIAERKNVLCMFFYVLTFLFYLRHESELNLKSHAWKWYGLSLLCFLLALLSKTAVVMLPFVLLLGAWWQRGRITRRDIARTIPFFIISLVLGLVTIWFQANRAIGADTIRSDTFLVRTVEAGWAIWFYLSKALLPLNLTFVYPTWSIDVKDFSSWMPGISLIAFAGLFWWFRRTWGRPFLFALAYFVIMLFPILGFVNVYFQRYSLVADHWQYFSIIAPIALAVGLAVAGLNLALRKIAMPDLGIKASAGVSVGSLVLVMSVLSWNQAGNYADAETIWRDTLQKNPSCWLAHNNWGLDLAKEGRVQEAIAHYEAALRIKPDQIEARVNLGSALLDSGRLDDAMTHFQEAIKINPQSAVAYYNIGNTLDRQGKPQDAMAYYRKALQFNPSYADAYNNLACLLIVAGKSEEAMTNFQAALTFEPDKIEACNNLGSLLLDKGKTDEAVNYLTRALKLKPDYADAHHNLGNALFKLGKLPESADHYRAVIQLRPDYADAHYKLANVLLNSGKADEAAQYYNYALQKKPDFPEAHYQMGVLLVAKKQTEPGLSHLREAVRLKPDWPEAVNNLAWNLAITSNQDLRDDPEALRLAEHAVSLTSRNDPSALDTLAAAYAQSGQFDRATRAAKRAVELAGEAGQKDLATQIQARLRLYESQKPYRE